jgi:hypothetical protein
MTFESYEMKKQVKIGAKLTLIGGIFFVVALIVHASQPNLGFEEQSLLSLIIMASTPVWVIGGVCFGVAADNWLLDRGQNKRY